QETSPLQLVSWCAATRHTPSTAFAVGHRTGKRRAGKKPGGGIKNLEIIQDCCAIYRSLEKELKLTHVGTEGNELADRMAMLGAQRKEKRTATVSGNDRYSRAAENAGKVIKKVVFRK